MFHSWFITVILEGLMVRHGQFREYAFARKVSSVYNTKSRCLGVQGYPKITWVRFEKMQAATLLRGYEGFWSLKYGTQTVFPASRLTKTRSFRALKKQWPWFKLGIVALSAKILHQHGSLVSGSNSWFAAIFSHQDNHVGFLHQNNKWIVKLQLAPVNSDYFRQRLLWFIMVFVEQLIDLVILRVFDSESLRKSGAMGGA